MSRKILRDISCYDPILILRASAVPRATLQQDLDMLVSLIGSEPAGMTIDAISRKLGNRYQRRTLQRRLALLVEQKRIEMLGERRATRYRRLPASGAVSHASAHAGTPLQAPTGDYYVPVSAEGAGIRAHVSQPRHLRSPVGYRLEFLEQYQPNQTAYLSPDLRDQLHAMGRSPAGQASAGTFAKDILSRLLIDLSWASSHLEGNTYSRLDTERLIAYGQAAEGKDALETQMILNHKQAIEYLVLPPGHDWRPISRSSGTTSARCLSSTYYSRPMWTPCWGCMS